MTKKHFEAFARYIRSFTHETDHPDYDRANTLARMVVAVARESNVLFSEEKFLKACGLELRSAIKARRAN